MVTDVTDKYNPYASAKIRLHPFINWVELQNRFVITKVKMRRFYLLGLIGLAAIIIGLAWAEQITLTTYYPAPYGIYKDFSTTSKTILATEANSKVGIGTTTPTEELDVSGKIYATEDVCIDTATGPVCLSDVTPGPGWQYSNALVLNNIAPPTANWGDIDLSPRIGRRRALVFLKIQRLGGFQTLIVGVRPNGDLHDHLLGVGQINGTHGVSAIVIGTIGPDPVGTLMTETDAQGIIEWKADQFFNPQINLWLVGFVPE